MTHVLFLNIPASGHVQPTLGVVEELVRRGHRVTYAATGRYADDAAVAGAEVLPYETTLDPQTIVPAEAENWLARVLLGSVRAGAEIAPAVLARFADGPPPDVVAYDISMQFLGRVLARRWGRPAVQFYPVSANRQQYGEAELGRADHRLLRREFVDLAATHGVTGTFEELNDDADVANVVFLAREFQFRGEGFPEPEWTFVGPCVRDRDRDTDWRPPTDGRRVVLISLGTTYNDQPDFFRTCAAAFADLPWHVVMTVGGLDPASVAPLPPNVEVHPWVPMQAFLEPAAVLVCHGGWGTVMHALHAGTPVVVVPQIGESDEAAAQVAALGLGEVLRPDEVTPEVLRDAVLRLSADEDVAASVAGMQRAVRAAGGADRAVDRILEQAATAAGHPVAARRSA